MRHVVVVMALACGLVVPAHAQAPVNCKGPLALEQLVGLARNEVPEARTRQIVRECGVGFALDSGTEGVLRAAGASEGVIAAVRAAAPATTPSPTPTSGLAQAGAAEARKRFVAGRSFFLAKPSGKAPGSFNTQDVTVANPDYSARLHFEATPASLHAGVALQVKVFAENDGKKAIELENLNAFVTVNGSRGSVPSALKTREIAVGQRVLVAEVGGTWGEAVKSWRLDIVAATSRGETLKGSLSWK